MQLIGDKVLIRFTKENKESIFSKLITKEDGTTVRLFLNVDADYVDERKSRLFVQTGIVESVAPSVKNIFVGDMVIVDYMLCNDLSKLAWREDNGDDIFWCNATTKYHESDEIVYANRRTKHDTVVARKGDIEDLSSIYGVIRNDEIIARSPFIFLQHQENVIQKETKMRILYTETHKTFSRKILSCSEESTEKYHISKGENVLVHDADIFDLKLENMKIDCVMDMDILAGRRLSEYLKEENILAV